MSDWRRDGWYTSAEDTKAGDIVENQARARGYVLTPTADDAVLVLWEASRNITTEHWAKLNLVKCRG